MNFTDYFNGANIEGVPNLDWVELLACKELEEANKKHPAFHSTHEGYAVILEEVEEAEEALGEVKRWTEYLWKNVRSDKTLDGLDELYSEAMNLATEAIQVAAMVLKFKDSMKGEAWTENY